MSAQHESDVTTSALADLRRRDFVALSVATGVAGAALPAAAAPLEVVEKNVAINTADGTCDAAWFHPATGKHPGVLL